MGTPTKILRIVYVCEFLLAIVAIFTAWSEIGGQSALDLMHWGWKLGLSVPLAAAIVAYTAALLSEQRIWTLRSARWLTAILILLLAIGIVTYYYALQVDNGDTDENSGNVSFSCVNRPAAFYIS